MAVLFRGKKNGRILDKVLQDFQCPEWMMLQTQENGSYRSEDVCEFLEWALPQATSPEESIIVVLDWYAGHRTEEVEALLKRMGHVLLFHGGRHDAFHADQ
jgi:ribulose kinase